MPTKFAQSKTPHPTPPVCKGTIPSPTTDLDPCDPEILSGALVMEDILVDGEPTTMATGFSAVREPGTQIWRCETRVALVALRLFIEINFSRTAWRFIGECSGLVTDPITIFQSYVAIPPCPPLVLGPGIGHNSDGPERITLIAFGP